MPPAKRIAVLHKQLAHDASTGRALAARAVSGHAPVHKLAAQPLSPTIGAVLGGIEMLSLTKSGDEALHHALMEHHVLVLPKQQLTVQQLAEVGRRFGEPYMQFGKEAPAYTSKNECPEVTRLVFGSSEADRQMQQDLSSWHMDHSYSARPTQMSFLHAEEVPPTGGQTLFLNAAAAFRALSPVMQEMLVGMTCIHNLASGYPSRESDFADVMQRNPPLRTPLVYVHPQTGARVLNVNESYTTRICELSQQESNALLGFLKVHVTRPEFAVEHRWQKDDLVIFDNLICQHYVSANYWPHRRVMRNISLLGPEGGLVAAQPSAQMATIPRALPDAEATTRRDLAAGLRLLHRQGQSDMAAGFFVARSPTNPNHFYASPHGTFWSEVTPDHFTVYCVTTGERVDGSTNRLPNAPVCPLASAVFSMHPEVSAMIHAHGPNSMALTAVAPNECPILPMSEPSFMFYERVKSLKCDFFFGPEYVRQVAEALVPPTFALVLRNHAYIMTGRSIQECYLRAYMFEQAAAVQLRAMQAGPPRVPPVDEILYHRQSYEGFPGCPAYDGALEWDGLLRELAAAGLQWCKPGAA